MSRISRFRSFRLNLSSVSASGFMNFPFEQSLPYESDHGSASVRQSDCHDLRWMTSGSHSSRLVPSSLARRLTSHQRIILVRQRYALLPAEICFKPHNKLQKSEVNPMRNVARLKMGYYPLPESEGIKLRSLLSFHQPASVIDPCAGQGTALDLVTSGGGVRRYGVELDAGRARIASSKGIT